MGLPEMLKYATLDVRYTHFSLPPVACIYEALIKNLKKEDKKNHLNCSWQTNKSQKNFPSNQWIRFY
jgi:hypothetical protein